MAKSFFQAVRLAIAISLVTVVVDGTIGFAAALPNSASIAPSLTWIARAPMPTPRGELSVVAASNGNIYAIGGSTAGNASALSVVDEYDPTTNTWTTKAPIPIARYDMGAAATAQGKIYVADGIIGSLGVGWTSSVEVYDTTTDIWTSVASLPQVQGAQGLVAASDGMIYSLDGWLNGPINSVYAYNPQANVWTARASAPTARADVAAVIGSNGLIYVLGGDGGVNAPPLSTVEAYNTQTNSWNSLASMPTPREHLAAVAIPGKIVVLGGTGQDSQGPLPAVEVYDLATNQWTTQTNLPTAMADLGAAYVPNRGIYAIGGFDSSGATLSLTYQGVIATPPPPPTNLVQDGSFERPHVAGTSFQTYFPGQGFGGWSVRSGSIDLVGQLWQAASGYQSVDLSGNGTGILAGSLAQNLATQPGLRYALHFAMAGNPDTLCGPQGLKTMQIYWNDQPVDTLTFDTTGHSFEDMGWVNEAYTLTATGSTTNLQFVSLTNSCAGPTLDDVSVIPIG